MAATESATRTTRALDELYRAHAGEVYRYAYAVLGNHADAEDVTQTTFVNALRALERGERVRKPSNWLITIAHNVVRQRFRQQQARPSEVELDHDVASREEPGEGPTLEELVQALQRIPHTQREAIVMRELEGRSYKEIAAVLELTPAALEALLFRARRSLAEELENAVTCERAELAISNRADGRLSRKDRRRLDEHLRECPTCARLSASRSRQRHAFRALAVLPLPLSLTFFKGAPTASAAAGLPTIGAGTAAATGGGAPAAVGGGLLAGGVVLKAVAVVAAVTVAGAAGYGGVQAARDRVTPLPAARTAPERAVATAPQPTRPADRTRSSPAPAAAQAASAPQRAPRDVTAKEPGASVSAGETPSTASPAATAAGVPVTPSAAGAPSAEAPASGAQPAPQAQAPAANGSGEAPATRTVPKAKTKPVKGPKKVKARALPPQAAAPARMAQEPEPPPGPKAEPAEQPAGAGRGPGPTRGAEMSQSP